MPGRVSGVPGVCAGLDVVAFGKSDGVHVGHQALLSCAAAAFAAGLAVGGKHPGTVLATNPAGCGGGFTPVDTLICEQVRTRAGYPGGPSGRRRQGGVPGV